MADPQVRRILESVLDGQRLSVDDCTRLLESYDVAAIGAAADEIRQRRHPHNVVTYIIDRNINYTNICTARCTFCANYVTGRTFRYRSAANVVAELNAYHDLFGTTFFPCWDDALTANRRRLARSSGSKARWSALRGSAPGSSRS